MMRQIFYWLDRMLQPAQHTLVEGKEGPPMTHADRALLYRLLEGQETVLANQHRMMGLLQTINQKEDIMAVDLTDMAKRVAASNDAEASATLLLNDLKSRLDTAIAALPTTADKAALQALSDAIGVNTPALSAAVVADTPAAADAAVAQVDPAPAPTA